jgi:hypothetical protein
MLHPDGKTISGWTTRPAGGWAPDAVLWHPPGAKSIDSVGRVVDATEIDDAAFVRAELDKRQRYLDRIRRMVVGGVMRLTPALAKFLGLPSPDGVELVDRHEPTLQQVLQQIAYRVGSN